MYAWFYGGSPLVVYPLVALFLFLAVFVGVLVRVGGRRWVERHQAEAALPLFDSETHFLDPTNRGERHA